MRAAVAAAAGHLTGARAATDKETRSEGRQQKQKGMRRGVADGGG